MSEITMTCDSCRGADAEGVRRRAVPAGGDGMALCLECWSAEAEEALVDRELEIAAFRESVQHLGDEHEALAEALARAGRDEEVATLLAHDYDTEEHRDVLRALCDGDQEGRVQRQAALVLDELEREVTT